ncbi:MAG: ATP-binding protein [Bacteroidales bacterium]|nr:ATP-binding protein [Bacteroidales bacterium]
MERNVLQQLKEWKSSSERKPLILEGARQVGKTWIMKEFGRLCYKNTLYINCDDEPRMQTLLADDYDTDRILLGLQAISNVTIDGENTLVILDEIQEVPRGLHLLKYFCEKTPWLHIVVAGSLLGITLHKGESYPVGKVNIIRMYPMSFMEFANAVGESQLIEILRSRDYSLMSVMHTKLIDLLRQYYFVGGMPEIVKSYIKEKNIAHIRQLQSEILNTYQKDISKHSVPEHATRILQVLNSIPSQLAKENKKFIYGVLRKGARATQYELAIQWLINAGLVHKVPRVSVVKTPLKFYEDLSAFKLYFLDCGLLGCLSDADPGMMLIGNNPFVEFKGAFAEQYVLQQLVQLNNTPYYWSAENATSELDFIIQKNGQPIPIEVKSSDNLQSKSLSFFLSKNDGIHGIRFSTAGYRKQENMQNIPLYAVETTF